MNRLPPHHLQVRVQVIQAARTDMPLRALFHPPENDLLGFVFDP